MCLCLCLRHERVSVFVRVCVCVDVSLCVGVTTLMRGLCKLTRLMVIDNVINIPFLYVQTL